MELIIASPDETRAFRVAWFEIETPAGNFVIQAGHAPTILTLVRNRPIIVRLKNGKQESLDMAGGVVHVTRTRATVLVGS